MAVPNEDRLSDDEELDVPMTSLTMLKLWNVAKSCRKQAEIQVIDCRRIQHSYV